MDCPGSLDAFATDIEIGNSLDRIRRLGIDWPEIDVLELLQDKLSR